MIDVIVPVLNNPEGILQLLERLDRQTLPAEEYSVIVVDNGSTDRTPEVVRSHRPALGYDLTLIEYDEIKTSYAARNQGVQNSQARFLAFTDSDCLPQENWLAEGLKVLEETEASLVPGKITVTYQNDEPNLWEYLDAALKFNQDRYVEEGWGATANLFVARRCFEDHGLFKADLTSGGDSEFGRRLAEAGEPSAYAKRAVVEHPARRTLGAVIKKELRIAEGHQQLHERGVRKDPLSWKDFVPQPWIPPLDGVELTFWDKLAVMTGFNVVRLTYACSRLKNALRSQSRG